MSTQSALDLMTASVIDRKVAAGAQLTPVGVEAARATPLPLPHTAAAFPNDVPDEAILQRVGILEDLFGKLADVDETVAGLTVQIRTQYAAIREALDAVKAELGGAKDQAAPDPAVAQKAKEQAADARVAASAGEEAVAAMMATQEAVFAAVRQPAPVEIVLQVLHDEPLTEAETTEAQALWLAASQWQCPVHHVAITKTSRLGREYRACNNADCKQFEKL